MTDTRMPKPSCFKSWMPGRWLSAAAVALSLAGCAATQPAVPLEGTYWRLMEIEGLSVSLGTGERGPHVQFDPEKKRVTGYGGVNSFFAGYDTTGGRLLLSPLAATRRAGPPELMTLEATYLRALSATRSYHISGDKLELLDTGGRVLARFEARAGP